ncbi:MAG TPA: hypothetical protein VGI81_01570 [Tepidisphaeraceae bacterium]
MGVDGFKTAFARGEPLADVTVVFRPGVDGVAATQRLNALADDFDLHPSPYYNDPRMRLGTATKMALQRLFGWRIQRAPLPGGAGYWWTTVTEPSRYPDGCESLIERMGLSQPGADDDGQWLEWPEEQAAGDGDATAGYPAVEHRSVMRQRKPRHFPFGSVGIVLMIASVLPTAIGMVRGFNQLQRGQDATAVGSGVAVAFHPAFIACGALGALLVGVALVRALRRGGRTVA